MLSHLNVKNYALIKELDIDFLAGYTSITGETGAGKSILLGAIGLIMGDRGDSTAILDPSQKCIIEAIFDIERLSLSKDFDDRDIDYSDQTIIRREWLPNGKMRSFINDSQVSLQSLKWLGTQLLEIHSQHTGLLVTQHEEQLKLIDAFSMSTEVLVQYQQNYHAFKDAEQLLSEKKIHFENLNKESDYTAYILSELQEFAPQLSEDSSLEAEIELLEKATQLEQTLTSVEFELLSDEQSVIEKLGRIRTELKPFSSLSPQLNDFFERTNGLLLESRELSRDVTSSRSNFDSNPNKLESLLHRYNKLQLLLRKHNVTTVEALIGRCNELENTHLAEHHLEKEITELTDKLSGLHRELIHNANILGTVRRSKKDMLSNLVVDQLKQLDMPYAQTEVRIESMGEQFNSTGNDRVSIFFSANKGQSMMPIEKIASGGEISRLNFCLRTIIAELKQLPTLIYDEADTGVSGEVASRLGFLMRKQGGKQQILAITHLPQVAASGNQQLFVYKSNEEAISETKIKHLNETERVHALAEMLSGKNPGEAARLNAQSLLKIQSA